MRILFFLILIVPHLCLADEREECRIALVEDLSGTVGVSSPTGEETVTAAGDPVQPGDLVHTGAASWVDLRLCDGTGLRVGEDSRFSYQGAETGGESFVSWAFELLRGSLRAAVVGDGKAESVKVRVRTPSASLGVRGTELVIDANDSGKAETELHTLEGEVLMGPREDFDKLATLHGSALLQQFEPVGAEKMSVIHAGEAHPLRAAAFKLWEFKAARPRVFSRNLEKRGSGEVRARFQNAHQRLKAKRIERGLFERHREKIEEKMRPAAKLGKPFPLPVKEPAKEKIQEKNTREAERRERLQEKLRSYQEKAKDRRERKGWTQRRNNQPASPRFRQNQ